MITYIIRRIIMTIPLLIGVSIVSFGIVQLTPGDPGAMMMDPTITEEDRAQYMEAYGLNDPIPVQYVRWIGQILQGNLGYSLIQEGMSVSELILARLPNTLILMIASTILAMIIAIPIGIYSATRPYTLTDYTITTASFMGVAIPNFWFGLVLIMFFAVQLGWFPSGGAQTLHAPFNIWDRLHHLILPAIVLATADTASLTRYTRSSMIEVLDQDYIRTARAKGFKQGKVVYKHGVRNGLIPVLTLFGLMIPSFIGGAVITEKIFNWPGIGLLFIDATFQRDYPIIMALTMISAVLVVIGNLIADILYAIFDPRIEY
ncbi:MAG TPA: ABC transporter permease [Virgibacillus sp.]|nr:ABC transporter permease [Virgibacillus sp.]